MRRQLKDYQPDLIGGVLIFGIWALFLTLVSTGVEVLFPTLPEEISVSIGAMLGTGIVVYVFFWLRSISLSRLFSPSLGNPAIVTPTVLVLVILLSCCVFIIAGFVVDVAIVVESGSFPNFIPLGRRVAIEQLPANILSSLITAPFCEEIIYTGIVMRGLLHHRSPLYAIVASSVLFGIVHILNDNALFATLASLLTGWIYWRTRSLWPAILAHVSINLISITTGYVSSSIPQSFFYTLLVVSVLLFPLLILQMHKLTRGDRSSAARG